ncbi:MAG: bacteriohemerythrin [Desulfobacteraceae bacterium]|nr:bacteriohemerythrin [Desulfobacteraceae bacterium]
MTLKRYRHWPIRAKILAIPILSCIVILIGVEFAGIPFFGKRLMQQKMNATRQVVEVAYRLIENNARLANDGKMTPENAQNLAKEEIKTLRYSGKEYFWINDLGTPFPRMIMHPTVPDLDGKVLDDIKFNKANSLREGSDGELRKLDGKNLFAAMNEAVARSGQGFVNYEWPKPKEGGGVTSELYPKLSYVKKFEPWGWVIGSGVYVDDVNREVNALRLPLYAATIVFSAFMLLLAYSVGNGIRRSLHQVITRLKEMACGDSDLTHRFVIDHQDETGEVAQAFNGFLDNQQKIISLVMQNATQVAEAATELNGRAEAMVQGADRVATDASSVANATAEMSDTSNDIAANCIRAVEASRQATELTQQGTEVVNGTIAVMARIADQVRSSAATVGLLGAKSDQIGAIVGTIQDIADQTNLLALNAAIEAARAGDMGRGFAVVADEVRALAERTTKATREIGSMIKAIQAETNGAVESMNRGVADVQDGTAEAARSGATLGQILDQVSEVTQQINQIATAAEEQSATTGDIGSSIIRITDGAHSSSSYAQDTVQVAEKLNRLSEELISTIDRFRTIIKWNDRMSVHVPQFDEQHKQLVSMIHRLNDAMKSGQGKQVVGDILTGLVQYADSHFTQEERFMQQHKYPDYAVHKQIHDDLRKKVSEVIVEYENGRAVPAAIMTFLSDWLISHIMQADRKYGEYMVSKGVVA